MFWVPSISPSSLMFYTGDKFPQLEGQPVRRRVERAERPARRVHAAGTERDATSQAERREPLLRQLGVRIRDVQQSPDGYMYVATELRSGGTPPDGTVLRIEPVDGF